MGKSVKKHKHPILDHPYPGTVLLILWGIFFYNFVVTIPALIITRDTDSAMMYYSSAIGGILLLLIHKQWFGEEYRGSFKRGTTWQKAIITAAAIFIATDLIAWCFDIYRMGFVLISFRMFGACLMAGFCEEATFRALPISIIMRKLRSKDSYLPALILPALLFGCSHIMNISSAPLSITLLQIFSCIGTGIVLGAIYLRTGSILMPIIIHVFHDFISGMVATQADGIANFEATSADIGEAIVLFAVQTILAIWLLKGHKEEIMDVWKERWVTEEP